MSSKTKTPATKQGGISALVPKLRFPEFRDGNGWSTYLLEELEDLGWVQLGRGDVISNQDIRAIPGEYPIYSSSIKSNGHMGSYGRFMFDEELISWSIDGGGDFFYRPPHKFSVTNVSGFMRLHTDKLNYRFTVSQLQAIHASLTFDYQFKAHPSVIRKLYRLAIPTHAEQKKIAECLSSVDEVIAAQARKLDALRAHKKGLMQQLFPREGETQPRLRFPEFQNAERWKPDTLEDLCTAKISYGIVQAGPHVPNGMPYIKSTDLNSELRLSKLQRTSDAIAKKYQRSEVVPGDLVFSLRGNIGVSQIIPKEIPVANLTQGTARMRLRGPSVFFLYALRSQSVYSRILAASKGSTFQEISLEHLRQIQVIHPEKEEQQHIATCLSTLDDLIAAETERHEALKTHKRGLMQHLFPSLEDVET